MCPLCQAREEMDRLLDDRTDITEANILDLFKELKSVHKEITTIKTALGLNPEPRWAWRPLQRAHEIMFGSRSKTRENPLK